MRDILVNWDGPDLATVIDNGDGTFAVTYPDGTEEILYQTQGDSTEERLEVSGSGYHFGVFSLSKGVDLQTDTSSQLETSDY